MAGDDLTHVDQKGNPGMVDVSEKQVSRRTATAQCIVYAGKAIMELLEDGDIKTKKGSVFHTAIVAGTQAVKNTGQMIPFCHPLPIDSIKITVDPASGESIKITCTVSVEARTGVEMEAITGATMAGITIYDMCKALSHDIIIGDIKLLEKTGGKKDFKRDTE